MALQALHFGFGRHTEFLPYADIRKYVTVSQGALVTVEATRESDLHQDTLRLLSSANCDHHIDQARNTHTLPTYLRH